MDLFFGFFFRSATVCKSLTRMHDDLTLMRTWHGVMADEEKFMGWKISTNTVYNTLKTDTKYLHSVRSKPTLKDEECFRNGLVRKPYERSLYERTIMSEPFIEKHAHGNREKHKLKSQINP